MLILHLGLVEGVELDLGLGGSRDDLLDLVLLEGGVLQETVGVPFVLFLSDEELVVDHIAEDLLKVVELLS